MAITVQGKDYLCTSFDFLSLECFGFYARVVDGGEAKTRVEGAGW